LVPEIMKVKVADARALARPIERAFNHQLEYRSDYPTLARTALDGSAVTEEALRQILWTKK
jgi:hypothetical protein